MKRRRLNKNISNFLRIIRARFKEWKLIKRNRFIKCKSSIIWKKNLASFTRRNLNVSFVALDIKIIVNSTSQTKIVPSKTSRRGNNGHARSLH